MPVIVGLCGLSGVGKSTTMRYLVDKVGAHGVYLGEIVLEEVRRRGMEQSRESERFVRSDLRKDDRSEIMLRGLPQISEALVETRAVIIDAIVLPEELDCLRNNFSDSNIILLEITASINVRVPRLQARSNRPYTPSELHARDNLEITDYRTDIVFKEADFRTQNDGAVEDLHRQLAHICAIIENLKH